MLITIITISEPSNTKWPGNYLYVPWKAVITYCPSIYTSTSAQEMLTSGARTEAHDPHNPIQTDQWPQAQVKARTGHTSNHSQEGHFMTWTWSCCRSPFTQTHSHARSLGHLFDPQPGPSFTEIHPWTPKLHPKLVVWIGFSDTCNQENHRGTFYSTFCSTEPHWHELQNSLFWK